MKMIRSAVAIATLSLMAGCANLQGKPQEPGPDVEQLLSNQTQALTAVLEQHCQGYEDQTQAITALSAQVEELQGQIQGVHAKPQPAKVECPKVNPASPIGDKMILGEVERVFVQETGMAFETRVDTGAESSSIDAQNITLFERDGKQWVRFDVSNREGDKPEPKTVEARVARIAQIKKGAADGMQERPVIMARLKLGNYVAETELNLNDRSHLDYPLLLGRKFIKDIAVVDVSRKHVQTPTEPKGTK
ncbi:ATP-dependent zinc protease [Ferrimonas sp. YFM]|uniref:ATP-dependent zinc protease family protein n=1 Tax=Ferrimonas sp. YFM TaxID=3028878 RepID=UPI00257301FE|nr:ATP-dependent zinc protease [Ferrimonas sp. YFM]BDY04830.1 ATP-dependent Zn protease [Ferrimonas sp. YFM]